MTRKLSIAKIALVLFIIILFLSIYALMDMQSRYRPSYFIDADKLNEQPTKYFSLANPDKYVIEAINTQSYVHINSLDDTQIDELTNQHGTNNVLYKGNYYRVSVVIGDSFPPFMLLELIIAGIALSITVILILSVILLARYLK
jgi:hypothetical protein